MDYPSDPPDFQVPPWTNDPGDGGEVVILPDGSVVVRRKIAPISPVPAPTPAPPAPTPQPIPDPIQGGQIAKPAPIPITPKPDPRPFHPKPAPPATTDPLPPFVAPEVPPPNNSLKQDAEFHNPLSGQNEKDLQEMADGYARDLSGVSTELFDGEPLDVFTDGTRMDGTQKICFRDEMGEYHEYSGPIRHTSSGTYFGRWTGFAPFCYGMPVTVISGRGRVMSALDSYGLAYQTALQKGGVYSAGVDRTYLSRINAALARGTISPHYDADEYAIAVSIAKHLDSGHDHLWGVTAGAAITLENTSTLADMNTALRAQQFASLFTNSTGVEGTTLSSKRTAEIRTKLHTMLQSNLIMGDTITTLVKEKGESVYDANGPLFLNQTIKIMEGIGIVNHPAYDFIKSKIHAMEVGYSAASQLMSQLGEINSTIGSTNVFPQIRNASILMAMPPPAKKQKLTGNDILDENMPYLDDLTDVIMSKIVSSLL